MKSLIRSFSLLVALVALAGATTVYAGKCCDTAAEKTRKGETCAKCEDHECCKKACEKVKEDGEAKPCDKCAAKKEDKKDS